jgi:hypothetical protein
MCYGTDERDFTPARLPRHHYGAPEYWEARRRLSIASQSKPNQIAGRLDAGVSLWGPLTRIVMANVAYRLPPRALTRRAYPDNQEHRRDQRSQNYTVHPEDLNAAKRR